MKICIFYGARNQLDGHRLCPQWGGLRLNLDRLGPKALWFIKSAWGFKFETYQYIINSYRIDPLNLHIRTIFGLMIRKYFSDGLKPPIRVCLKWHFRLNGESDDKPTECSTLFSKPYYHLLCIHSQYKNKIWRYDHIYIYIYNLQMCCRLRFVSPSHRQSGAGEYKKERRRQMRPNALFMDESIYRSRGLAGSNMQHVTQKASQSLIQSINGSLQLPQSCSGSRKDGLRNPLEDNRIPWYCDFSSIMFVFQAAKIMKISRFSPSPQFSDAKSPCQYEVSIQMIHKPPHYPKLIILLPLNTTVYPLPPMMSHCVSCIILGWLDIKRYPPFGNRWFSHSNAHVWWGVSGQSFLKIASVNAL